MKYLGARAIGFDHFDLPTAKELGMPVTHVFYPPSGVANYAIMLMLMCCRKMRQILDRNVVQDYTLEGKMGREMCIRDRACSKGQFISPPPPESPSSLSPWPHATRRRSSADTCSAPIR